MLLLLRNCFKLPRNASACLVPGSRATWGRLPWMGLSRRSGPLPIVRTFVATTAPRGSSIGSSKLPPEDVPKKSESEWKKVLTPEQYHVCREGGTERAFTGKFYGHSETGNYLCVACGNPLFSSTTKFESGSGWPSFYKVKGKEAVREIPDNSFGMSRTEVRCSRCDSHLGHVFEDTPFVPTGRRYCINSVALAFQPQKEEPATQT
ncbi:Peptide methionine sulfoxide reductase MsrB [Balamuthia mandrillaris]